MIIVLSWQLLDGKPLISLQDKFFMCLSSLASGFSGFSPSTKTNSRIEDHESKLAKPDVASQNRAESAMNIGQIRNFLQKKKEINQERRGCVNGFSKLDSLLSQFSLLLLLFFFVLFSRTFRQKKESQSKGFRRNCSQTQWSPVANFPVVSFQFA